MAADIFRNNWRASGLSHACLMNLWFATITRPTIRSQSSRNFRVMRPLRSGLCKTAMRMGSTRNFDQAIGMASGEFIALCDQDDRWLPMKLERLAKALNENTFLGGAFSDAVLIDGDSRPTGMRLFARHKFTHAKQQDFVCSPTSTLLKHDVVTGATLMFRASIRRYCSPIPATWVHDGWLAWMIALHSRLTLIPEPLIEYRIHAGQQLGVGGPSLAPVAAGKKETRRQHYVRVARQFEDLLDRVLAEGWSKNDCLVGKDSCEDCVPEAAIGAFAEPRSPNDANGWPAA